MSKLIWKTLQLGLAVLVIPFFFDNITLAGEVPADASQISNYAFQISEDAEAIAQITSVSQLSDVLPTDWAFQALQSLVERYGCIAGYPDNTYRGNRAITRYEFAAGLNACLERVNELIATATSDLVAKQDLASLQRLREQFASELSTLRDRINNLEVYTGKLEANQFSPTTKLGGELITYLTNAFGENAGDINNATLGYRLRLDFLSSFTGQDRLKIRLQSTNLRQFDTGATFGGSQGIDSTGQAIGFGNTGETRFTPSPVDQNSEVKLEQIQYRFPVGKRLQIYLEGARTDPSYITDPISPFIETATGALSNFGQVNPIYFPLGNQGGIGGNFLISPALSLDFGYLGEIDDANSPSIDGGIFNGGYSAFTQLLYNDKRFKLGLLYINCYSNRFGVDTLAGSNAAKVTVVNDLNNEDNNFSNPVVSNSYGAQANIRVFDGFELGGWVGYTAARAVGEIKGDADVWNYAVTLHFPDLLKKGNAGGVVVGMEPRLTATSNDTLAQAIGLPAGQRKDRDAGLHIEAFYRIQLNNNVSITPGFFWLTAPNHDERNSDAVIGVIRTTFLF